MDRPYKMDFDADKSLKEWAKDKPLSILQLDPADRAVLRIAGTVCVVQCIAVEGQSMFLNKVNISSLV